MKLSSYQLETGSLFLLDGLANAIDFAFHFWMGRVLIPSDFAILQTLNSIALVYVTASGVFQPVVGRLVAEARGKEQHDSIPTIFQSFLRAAFWLGLVLSILVFCFSYLLSQFFNLPPWTIRLSAALIFLSSLRPIALGVLQGQERFVAFGFSRLALSIARILLVVFLIQTVPGLTGAVLALPFGWLASVLCAFLFLGRVLWKKSETPVQNILSEAWKLSAYALLAYLAYMSLTSFDLVWVNQNLDGESAGAYASLVLMRRIVALLPGVAVTIMFPGIAKILAQGQRPHRLLIQTAFIICAAGSALTIAYFVFANQLIGLVFNNAYQAAAPLLGWMGIAMMGVSLSSIWLNYYLAERPRNFVILLTLAVVLEGTLLNILPASLANATLAFGASGWLLSLGGGILYISRLPRRANTASQ